MTKEEANAALLEAAKIDQVEALKAALYDGADVHARDKDGETALMLAAGALVGDAECVRLLIEAGSDVNACDKDGETSLMKAAFAGSAARMKLLMAAGADIKARDKKGNSVLWHTAASVESGIDDRVNLLVDAGVELTEEDRAFIKHGKEENQSANGCLISAARIVVPMIWLTSNDEKGIHLNYILTALFSGLFIAVWVGSGDFVVAFVITLALRNIGKLLLGLLFEI